MTKEITVTVEIRYHEKLCLSKCQFLVDDGCILFYEELSVSKIFGNHKRCSQCLKATGNK